MDAHIEPFDSELPGDFPCEGVLIWIIATSFMLWEAELAYITLD